MVVFILVYFGYEIVFYFIKRLNIIFKKFFVSVNINNRNFFLLMFIEKM